MSNIRNSFGIDFLLLENYIYLDSATIGRLPASSVKSLQQFYEEQDGGKRIGTHKVAIQASRLLEEKRKLIADVFDVAPSQLSFLPSREVAILNALFSLNLSKNDRILTSVLEDNSIIAPTIKYHSITKSRVDYMNLESEMDLTSTLQNNLSKETKAVILSALTLGIGVKRNWKEIAKICNDNDVRFILDISYLVGHEHLSFKEITPDFIISSSSSGALGPQGIAFQIISEEIENNFEPLLVGGGSIVSLEKDSFKLVSGSGKFEPGTLNLAAISGLANSLQLLSKTGFDKIRNHEIKLRKLISQGLKDTSSIELVEIEGVDYGPILSFFSTEIDAHDIAIILEDISNVIARSGALCTHLFLNEIKQDSLVQISTHLYNTEDEIKQFNETIQSIMNEL